MKHYAISIAHYFPSGLADDMALALDCEMISVKRNATDKKFKCLAGRVSIVDENCQVLMDEFCKPDWPCEVIEYNTFRSGLTAELLETADSHSNVRDRAKALLEVRIHLSYEPYNISQYWALLFSYILFFA